MFAVYRDPIEIIKSIYSKYINNSKGVYTDDKYLQENGGHVSKSSIIRYHYIQSKNLSFHSFLQLNNKRFLPYDNVFSINEKYLDFKIDFNSLSEDFELVLNKTGIQQVREIPVYNKTKDKKIIENIAQTNMFLPYYN